MFTSAQAVMPWVMYSSCSNQSAMRLGHVVFHLLAAPWAEVFSLKRDKQVLAIVNLKGTAASVALVSSIFIIQVRVGVGPLLVTKSANRSWLYLCLLQYSASSPFLHTLWCSGIGIGFSFVKMSLVMVFLHSFPCLVLPQQTYPPWANRGLMHTCLFLLVLLLLPLFHLRHFSSCACCSPQSVAAPWSVAVPWSWWMHKTDPW